MANLRAPAGDVMAEARGLRAASRQKSSTPHPEKPHAHAQAPAPAPAPAPAQAQAPAARRLRSQSRDMDPMPELQKQPRRSQRQANVTSVLSQSDNEALKPLKSRRRKNAKDAAALDLTVVEEVDTEIAFDDAPATPNRIDLPFPLEQQAFRSPGATSEMSGTTAISSFSMIEAEFLEPKYMLKHMRKLCDAASEFLDHLAPQDATITDDHSNIQEMLKPGSEFAEEFHDFDEELKLHLKHFKGSDNSYINPRAVHRALFGSHGDLGALQSGINPVLYTANIVVFAKQMISSSRNDKGVFDRLRQLDNLFPTQFMRSLVEASPDATAGDSALLKETFSAALEIRTQLAILSLERSASETDFEPYEALEGIFLKSEASEEEHGLLRGWSVAALGGEETSLLKEMQEKIAVRVNELRAFLPTDSQSLENGEVVDLEGLNSVFQWEAAILNFLHWVRLRQRELAAAVEAAGGPSAILSNVKQAIASPQPPPEEARPTAVPRDSPRKKRASFARQRRRSSRKFDPNAPIDLGAIDALKARERSSGVHFDPKDPQPGDIFEEVAEEDGAQQSVEEHVQVEAESVQVEAESVQVEAESVQVEAESVQVEAESVQVEDESAQIEDESAQIEDESAQIEAALDVRVERGLSEQLEEIQRDSWEPQGDATLVAGDDELEEIDTPSHPSPPKSTQDLLAALKKAPVGKENRKAARFVDRQPNAVRVDFGDGFDSSQATPGPSTQVLDKGKQRADPPPPVSRKRARDESDADEDEDGNFETTDRTAHAQSRRQNFPVSKRPRLNPPSSAPAPPSHQPPADELHLDELPADELPADELPADELPSSTLPTPQHRLPTSSTRHRTAPAPEPLPEPLPDCVPPSSTYATQRALALQNGALSSAAKPRQPRRTWTATQEDAFIAYMELLGPSYAGIQRHDSGAEGYGVLEEFSQVNFKDKARSMAINMIKSGTGLRPGFENVVTATSKDGRRLLDAGFTW